MSDAEAIERLEAENALLRMLLGEMLMDLDDYCERYDLELSYEAAEEHMDSRLLELGIEVGD